MKINPNDFCLREGNEVNLKKLLEPIKPPRALLRDRFALIRGGRFGEETQIQLNVIRQHRDEHLGVPICRFDGAAEAVEVPR